MTEKTKKEFFEYLEDKVPVEYLEEIVNDLGNIVDNNSYLGTQKEFNEFYIIDIKGETKQEITTDLLKHRISLMFEEFSEIVESCETPVIDHFRDLIITKEAQLFRKSKNLEIGVERNLVEVLDGLADLQYVLSGTVVALDLEQIFDEAYLDVHQNNMSKTFTGYAEVDKYVKEKFPDVEEEDIEIIPTNGLYILKVKHKIIKPSNHKKVNLVKYFKNVK